MIIFNFTFERGVYNVGYVYNRKFYRSRVNKVQDVFTPAQIAAFENFRNSCEYEVEYWEGIS